MEKKFPTNVTEPFSRHLECVAAHIGVSSILQWTGFTGVCRVFSKMGLRQRSGDGNPPVGSKGKDWVGEWGQSPREVAAKCEIGVQFLTFSCANSGFNDYRSRAWTVLLCKHTIPKKSRDSTGRWTHPNPPLGYASAHKMFEIATTWIIINTEILLRRNAHNLPYAFCYQLTTAFVLCYCVASIDKSNPYVSRIACRQPAADPQRSPSGSQL